MNAAESSTTLWVGRVASALAVLFLLFDAVMKLIKPAFVVDATVQLGYPETVIVGLGVTLVVCTVMYTIPQTSVLGAILLTGYLGGATATHVRLGGPLFAIVFPGMLGVLVWGGLWLRDRRLEQLLPVLKPHYRCPLERHRNLPFRAQVPTLPLCRDRHPRRESAAALRSGPSLAHSPQGSTLKVATLSLDAQ